MSIIYDPKKMLKKAAPEAKIKRMVKGNMSLKRTALSYIDGIDFIDKKSVSKVALKTIKGYKSRVKASGEDIAEQILADPKQLIHRVQNEVIFQISQSIRKTYAEEFARWLPSDAEEPDPEHQLNYGKTFKISEGINGEIPGERIGCKCGMEILVNETELRLD